MGKQKVTTFLDEEYFAKLKKYAGRLSIYKAAATLIEKGLDEYERRLRDESVREERLMPVEVRR